MILVAPRARFTAWRRDKTSLPREVWVLITANVVVALGYGVVSPVLPAYARNFGVSISAATFVITVFSVMRLCFAPASGVMVQRLGERRVYLTGLLIVRTVHGRVRIRADLSGSCWCSARLVASDRRCSPFRRWA